MFTKSNRSRIATALAVAFVLMAVAMPANATTSPIVVKKTVVSGATVQVTVKNTSTLPVAGTVAVQAVVNGAEVWSQVPVILLGGQCATVSAGFLGPVSLTVSVGLTDDPNPM